MYTLVALASIVLKIRDRKLNEKTNSLEYHLLRNLLL